MMNHCAFCRGPVDEQRVEHVHRWNDAIYILKNVPAEVCGQCGEVFFAPDTLKAMDKAAAKKRRPESHRSVPVFSF